MPDVLTRLTNDDESHVVMAFYCPGCGGSHSYCVKSAQPFPVWQWNGSMDKPTFTPSLLVNAHLRNAAKRCHLCVKDGRIEYLMDCWHDLRGKTVDMVAV